VKDQDKTKEHRVAEKRVAELETSEVQHKRKERKVQKALKYAESIIETVRGPLLVLDSDLRVVKVNRSFYDSFKVTPEETLGNFIYDLGNRQWDIPKLRTLLEDILPKDDKFDGYEVEHEFPGIGHKSMILNARRIHQEGIGAQMVLLAIEDITERKRVEGKVQALNQELERHITELQVVNEELKTFSYAVSHDLKAPLVTIGGFSRRLLEKYGDSLDEKGQQYLKMINTSSIQMEELIRDLLGFFSSGREAVNFSPLKMDKMVGEVFDQLKAMYPKRTIHLHVETMPDLRGDEAMITQVLVNLLSNAIKYTRPREVADIYVGGWIEAERNIYYVKDNGIGFLMEYADKLFNAFERLQLTEEFEGTGLGLAIVKRVIERHGGVVWAEGKIDEGATFNFSIPK
jgi:PAS domain S-box-containing protein